MRDMVLTRHRYKQPYITPQTWCYVMEEDGMLMEGTNDPTATGGNVPQEENPQDGWGGRSNSLSGSSNVWDNEW